MARTSKKFANVLDAFNDQPADGDAKMNVKLGMGVTMSLQGDAPAKDAAIVKLIKENAKEDFIKVKAKGVTESGKVVTRQKEFGEEKVLTIYGAAATVEVEVQPAAAQS